MICIIPAAGKSSRFPNMRPKWALTHPNGNYMFIEALKGLPLNQFSKIYLTVLKEHLVQFDLEGGINKSLEKLGLDFELCILDSPTSSQSETVYQTIVKKSLTGSFFIKDTDNFFLIDEIVPNSVCVFNLNKCGLINAGNKSYVEINKEKIVSNIIEKKIISTNFCTGGYSFLSTEKFASTYSNLSSTVTDKEIFISHVIFKMILDGDIFSSTTVDRYDDWGTLEDWNKYKKEYKTIFTDLDGVLVKNSPEYGSISWGNADGIEKNIRYLNSLFDSGKCYIVITTSRKEEYKDITIKQLNTLGIKHHKIIFDLPHCQRILVNDYAKSNPFPSCQSINIKRDAPDLEDMMSGQF